MVMSLPSYPQDNGMIGFDIFFTNTVTVLQLKFSIINACISKTPDLLPYLADFLVGDFMLVAVFVHESKALYTELCFERAWCVIDAGMNDSTVVTTLMGSCHNTSV